MKQYESCQQALTPIGRVKSPYKEKFGIPRQPGLSPHTRSEIHMLPPYDDPKAFKGLEDFSHIWIIFGFHEVDNRDWQPTVRPPRLGGNERIGVFATRSTHRPNGLGLSVVRLEEVRHHGSETVLIVSSADLLDGTPVYDIKPYLRYADSIPESFSAYADTPPDAHFSVHFSEEVSQQLVSLERVELEEMIRETLQLDPRPAYHRGESYDNRVYGIHLDDFNIKWLVKGQEIWVIGLEAG